MPTEPAWPPPLPPAWAKMQYTFHMWTQVVGKVALALVPPTNHFWNVTLLVTPRGLSTYPLPYDGRTFTIEFDLLAHRLVFECSDGAVKSSALEPMTVADFYAGVMRTLGDL